MSLKSLLIPQKGLEFFRNFTNGSAQEDKISRLSSLRTEWQDRSRRRACLEQVSVSGAWSLAVDRSGPRTVGAGEAIEQTSSSPAQP